MSLATDFVFTILKIEKSLLKANQNWSSLSTILKREENPKTLRPVLIKLLPLGNGQRLKKQKRCQENNKSNKVCMSNISYNTL